VRIGIITSEVGPAWGAQRYAEELATSLCADHSVVVIANRIQLGSEIGTASGIEFRKISKVEGVTSLQIVADSVNTGRQVLRIKRELGLDVLHEADMGKTLYSDVSTVQQVGWASFAASRRFSMPFWTESKKHLLATAFLRQPFVGLWFEKSMSSRRRLFITPSNFMKRDLMKYGGVDPGKIRVIPYGVNLNRFRPDAETRSVVRGRLGLSEDEPLISFSGWDLARKGLFTMIRALPFIPRAKLLVLGRENLPVPFLALAGRLGVMSRLLSVFTRRTEDYYVASDVSVLPSLYDSFGLVVLEAMACGVPTVASPRAGASELLTDGKDGYVLKQPDNHQLLAETVNSILGSGRLREKIGNEGRATASRYSWAKIAKLTSEVYEEASGDLMQTD